MAEFGDNFVEPEVDPAADFLAREQDQLAGLEDELETTVPPPIQTHTNGFLDLADNDFAEEVPKPAAEPVRQYEEESEKIKIWREEQKKRLEEKDAAEEKKKEEWKQIAKKELEDWYKQHNEQIAKTKAANRNAEKALEKNAEGAEEGSEWTRVAELCDFSQRKGRDVARLRSLILQLKQSGAKPKYPPRSVSSKA